MEGRVAVETRLDPASGPLSKVLESGWVGKPIAEDGTGPVHDDGCEVCWFGPVMWLPKAVGRG